MRIKAAGYIGSSITAEVVFGASDVPTVPCYAHFSGATVGVHRSTGFLCVLAVIPAPGGKDTTHEDSMEIRRRNNIRS